MSQTLCRIYQAMIVIQDEVLPLVSGTSVWSGAFIAASGHAFLRDGRDLYDDVDIIFMVKIIIIIIITRELTDEK